MEDVLQLNGTAQRKTITYHPQSNGLTERLNKTITDLLSMYVNRAHKNLDDIFPYITFAYDTPAQETTRVHTGREAATMLDVLLLPHRCDIISKRTNSSDLRTQLALEQIHNQQCIDSQRYNDRHRQGIYQGVYQLAFSEFPDFSRFSMMIWSKFHDPYICLENCPGNRPLSNRKK